MTVWEMIAWVMLGVIAAVMIGAVVAMGIAAAAEEFDERRRS